jgi:OmpA-OmpF porin, OOP family
MCNWRQWLLPGIIATVLLTVLVMVFQAPRIERDLAGKALSALRANYPWAGFRLDGRDLVLEGTAPDEPARAGAAETVAGTAGIRAVVDQTSLPPLASPYILNVLKNDDGVTLTGHVPNIDVRKSLVAQAETSMPGIAVADGMELARGAPDGFATLAALGISQLAGMSAGSVELSDLNYSVSGTAIDSGIYEEEIARLSAPLPESGVLAGAEIAPPVVEGEYVWSAEKRADGTLLLDGSVPSLEVRKSILDEVSAGNGNSGVEGKLSIASGAPKGFQDAAVFALRQLATLAEGRAQLKGTAYSLAGRALTGNSGDDLAAAATEQLPEGYIAERIEIALPPKSEP